MKLRAWIGKLFGKKDAVKDDDSQEYDAPRTLADDFVKKSMINHYSIFPTRHCALEHLFLTIGNASYWKKEGDFFVPAYEEYGDEKDLDKIAPFKAYERTRGYRIKQQEQADQANAEFQQFLIDWTNKHIDILSTDYFHFYGHELRETRPYPHCKNYALIAVKNMPPATEIHPEWRQAIKGFCYDVMSGIRGRIGLGSEYPEALKILQERYPEVAEPFEVCHDAIEYLETKEDRERQAEVASMISNMLSDRLKAVTGEAE